MKRREFIKTAAGAALLSPVVLSGCRQQSALPTVFADSDAMDEALQMISGIAPLGNHAPMAVEALMTLGFPEQTTRFIEKYKKRFNAIQPNAVQKIDEKNWQAALGDGSRNLDWVNFFKNRLKEAEWGATLEKWTAVLAPGFCAAAGHGVLRTCHAVRSLSRQKTDLRLRELAEGLGYWAAYYQPLPEDKNANTTKWKPAQAIEKVPLLADEKRRRGSIMEQLKGLDGFQPFAGAINLTAPEGGAEQFLSELTESLSAVYLKNVSGRNDLILLHAVTATSALRSLLPYLSLATAQKVLIYGWQTAAGLYSIGAKTTPNKLSENKEINKEDLIARAVASNEEHAIKFTEACLREHALNPKPVYLQAAHDALGRLPSFP